ncbi:MAG: HupE/UreJ family protein [Deltaproteobacteria bacterium]|nr:HupE/UreJ family protein [Deltaproteobacteria bacterium]
MTPLLLALLLMPAHVVGLSRGVYVVDGAEVDVELTFARADVLALLPGVDADGDGGVTDAELTAVRPALAALVKEHVIVRRGEDPCGRELTSAGLVEGDGLTLAVRISCPNGGADVVVDFRLLEKLGAGHRHLGHVSAAGKEADVVAFAASPEFTLSGSAAAPPIADYLLIGAEHILLGFDHLVFLVGILIVLLRAGTLRSLVAVITAFTLAHSVTLGLAATGIVVPPSSLIEPAIALSIVFVGVESFTATDIARRWRITLPFGLVHGFGFAGALAEIGLPQDAVVPALAVFNIGVELGQLAVVLALYPLFVFLRKHLSPAHAQHLVKALSGVVVVLGLYWFIDRVT